MKKEWVLKNRNNDLKSVLDLLLYQRGLIKPEDVCEFLNPNEFKTISPYMFCDMKQSVERIKKAIAEKEKILIYGDFDADGITSTSLLIKTFKYLGADVDYFIPEREKHGHGLNFKALVGVMAKRKPNLIITVDCGVSDVKPVEQLKTFKIDTIITDHHEAKEELPNAIGIINPKAPYKLDEKLTTKEIVSLTSLAGVGVAFKLATAILAEYDKTDFVLDILPFVAVGTISDIVPLVYENRLLVTRGLDLISKGRHYGLKRLIEEAGYKIEDGINSEQIAFGVTPRINATGRLDNVDDSVKVLISDNNQEIELAINSLNNCNKIRQELCENTFLEAKDMKQNKNSIILFDKNWHVGIIGIVASKLVETYNKPAFMMTYSEETNQVRCSARGVEGLNIFDILTENSEMFDNYGGHAMAGGFSFSLDKYSFEDVANSLNKTIDEMLNGETLKPIIHIDLELHPQDINLGLIDDIEKLEPFGANNEKPLFAMFNLVLLQKKLMGSNKNHLKLVVQDDIGNTYDCIWWSKGDISLTSGDLLNVAFYPQINNFNGNQTIQFILSDVHSDKLVYDDIPSEKDFTVYDHRKKTGIFNSVEDYLKTSKLNIGIFAEDINIIKSLKDYPQIFNRIFNRTSIKPYDAVMFFDYPSSQELFEDILKSSSPRFIHFMNYEQKPFDEQNYIKTVAGMIKYSCNHYFGNFNIINAAAKLAIPASVVMLTIKCLDSVGIIEFNIIDETTVQIEVKNSEYNKILHSECYSELLTEIKVSEDYKSSFSNADLNYFCNIS